MHSRSSHPQAWIVAVDMGYGHQRAAHPLRHLSPTGEVLNANSYSGIPVADKSIWAAIQRSYETVSRLERLPIVGKAIFGIMDYFQEIEPFYPRRDESAPSLQVRQNYELIKRGLCKHLISVLNTKKIPLVTSFFTVAFAAEEYGFARDIYLIVCDTDASRAWAPLHPSASRIRYLAPTPRVVERLKQYGVRAEQIFLTGFPLPLESTGKISDKKYAERVLQRMAVLDPVARIQKKYHALISEYLGVQKTSRKRQRPLTLTFAIGGAGAQQDIAHEMLQSLKNSVLEGKIHLNLVAGSRTDVRDFFKQELRRTGLTKCLNQSIRIVFNEKKELYFEEFNTVLTTTDVLWTKPSEVSFYANLGLPIIIAPPLGSQEVSNRSWLIDGGMGVDQGDPRYTHEWLFDLVQSGRLAEAAWREFVNGGRDGVKEIVRVVFE